MNQNINSFGFDHIQPPQQFDNHQPQETPEVTPFVETQGKQVPHKIPSFISNSSEFNQPQQYSIDHQPQSTQEDLNQQRMNDVIKAMQSLVEKLRQQEQAANLSTHTPEPS
ncbi:hypothetical protein Tco_1194150 [Tanacetum coccineum]